MTRIPIIGFYPDGRPIYAMAGGDGTTVDNGDLADFTVASDTTAAGEVPLTKIAYSANSSSALVTADANGLEVQLGAELPAGTKKIGTIEIDTALPAGTETIGAVSFASTLNTGSNVIGKAIITDGTTDADVTSSGTNKALYTSIVDADGEQLAFAAPKVFNVNTSALHADAYVSGDQLGGLLTFSDASTGSGKTGVIVSAVLHDVAAQTENLAVWIFDSSVTPGTDHAGMTLSDADLAKCQGVITFTDFWSTTTGSVSVGKLTPAGTSLHYTTAGSAHMYGLFQAQGTGDYNSGVLSLELHTYKD